MHGRAGWGFNGPVILNLCCSVEEVNFHHGSVESCPPEHLETDFSRLIDAVRAEDGMGTRGEIRSAAKICFKIVMTHR